MGGLNLSPHPPLALAHPRPRAGGDPAGDTHVPQTLGALAKASLLPDPAPGCPQVQVRVGRATVTISQWHMPLCCQAHSSGTAPRQHPASIPQAEMMHEQNQPVPELPPLKTAGKKTLK